MSVNQKNDVQIRQETLSVITRPNSLASDLDIDSVIEGHRRLTDQEALRLYHEASIHDLGRWATAVADRMHGLVQRTYVIDRNINYTNVCSANCTFCAFKRDLGDADAYVLSPEQLHEKIRQLAAIGGRQILLQGGMHPDLTIEHYEDMLCGIKSAFPSMHVHGFSPPEFVEFVAVFRIDDFAVADPTRGDQLPRPVWLAKLDAIMRRLQAAGLDSVPGGGGEIFAPHVRRRIGLGKATAQQWLDVMACAHRLGMFTSATMMFGHIEGIADRIDHMLRIREAQDRAIEAGWPGRYVSFISWPFQRENTPMGRLPLWDVGAERESGKAGKNNGRRSHEQDVFPGDVPGHVLAGKCLRMACAVDYLRTQAISRLVLDNVDSIGSSWVTMGPKIGQLGLCFGANDMGSVMMEENVVSAAGTTYCLDEAALCHLIRTAGYVPAQRDNRYRILRIHDGRETPDQIVCNWAEHRVL